MKKRWTIPTLALCLSLGVGVVACDDKKADETEASKDESKKKDDDDDKAQHEDDDKDAKNDKKDNAKPAPRGTHAASAHLPDSCDAVTHVDIAKVMGSAPVKKHIVPALEAAQKKQEGKDAEKGDQSFTAFLKEADLDPMKDLTELAVCVSKIPIGGGGGDPDFGFALSGNLKKNILDALKKSSKDEKLTDIDIAGIKALATDDKDPSVAQAEDGVLVLASTEAMLKSMYKSSKAHEEYKLPDTGISIVVPGKIVKQAMEQSQGGGDNPFKPHAANAGRAAITADPTNGNVELRIDMGNEKAAIELGGFVKTLMPKLTEGPPSQDPMGAMAQGMLKDAKVDNQGSELVITLKVPADQLDAMAKQAAAAIGEG